MDEFPLFPKPYQKGTKKAVIVFPNASYGGYYALGPLILYNLINEQEGWMCERRFLETATDLHNFDLVGFTWQYELDLYKIQEIIQNNKITAPIFVGGPCTATNPRQDWADFVVIGDVEDTLPEILKHYKDKKTLTKIPGVYIPGTTKIPQAATAQEFWKHYPLYQPLPNPLPKNAVFGDVFMLEIERSCPFHCSYCSISKQFNTIRYIPLEEIKKIIDLGLQINKRDRVAIYCPAFTHPQRKEILRYILSKGCTFSVPSIRVEYADEELIDLIAQGGQHTITVAPECGETLRPRVGKKIPDSTFLEFAKLCQGKMKVIKLYIMVGLPGQERGDLDEIINLIQNMKVNFKGALYVSINPYVPKPGTLFAKHQFDKKKITQQLIYLKKNLKVRVKTANVNTSYKEWQIANAKK